MKKHCLWLDLREKEKKNDNSTISHHANMEKKEGPFDMEKHYWEHMSHNHSNILFNRC